MTATEIGKKLNLNKTTTHRLMMTLLSRGFIERREGTGVYEIGLKLIELCSIRQNMIELKTEADPFLRKLANKTNQTVQLAILDNDEVVIIARIERFTSIHLFTQIGKRIPIYCSAEGKSLVMDMDDAAIETMLDERTFQSFTRKTPITIEAVQKDIQFGRLNGYTIANEEHEVGLLCVAVPIRDYSGQIIATISLTGFERYLIEESENNLIEELKKTASYISKRMGYIH